MFVFCTICSNCESNRFRSIRVLGDGQCLFRCAAIFCNKMLQSCVRSRSGLPQSDTLAQLETECATELRRAVVSLMSQHINELDKLHPSISLLLDREIGKKYCSLTERIRCMRSNAEYAGNLEIVALAHNLQCQICVFTRVADDMEPYRLQAKFPTADGWRCMNIAYEMDTASTPGHFDFLAENLNDNDENCMERSTLAKAVKPDVSFMENILMMCGVTATVTGVDYLSTSTEPGKSAPDTRQPEVEPMLTENEDSGAPQSDKQSKPTEYRKSQLSSGTPQTQTSCEWLRRIKVKKGLRERVVCSVCNKYPAVVRRFYPKGPLPVICTDIGAEARSDTIANHSISDHHRECVRTEKLQSFSTVQKCDEVPILRYITSKNKELANKIGTLMINVYNDAKQLTLSAQSWPARIVADKMAAAFDVTEPFIPFEPSQFDLQYINPAFHRELIHTIVQADLPSSCKEIELALAGSFRCDASMDRTQRDNEFELLKIIDKEGRESLKFIGLGHVAKAGAQGHLEAIKNGADETVGFTTVLKCATHLSTDGENKNTGQHKGLWKLIEDERQRENLAGKPMLKSVCAVHSSSLAFTDLCKCVPEVKNMIRELSSIASHFHTSARRTADLEQIASSNGFTVRHLPTYYEVRWAEFSESLLGAVLQSWRALIAHFSSKEAAGEPAQFKKSLTNSDNVKLMCFLADLLFLLSNFQRKLQNDMLTILDIKPQLDIFVKKLEKLTDAPLLGGWEQAFVDTVQTEGDSESLHGHGLWNKRRRTGEANRFVTDRRAFSAIRNDSIQSLKNFMSKRLDLGANLTEHITSLSSFCNFTASAEDIQVVWNIVSPDLDLATLADQYTDVQLGLGEKPNATPRQVLQLLCSGHDSSSGSSSKTNGTIQQSALAETLARILVCKPHAADCERLISAYNRLKSTFRSRLDRKTIVDYLYINVNMPTLSNFDPRPAVLKWLSDKERRHRETPKVSKQQWFKTVFDNEEESGCDQPKRAARKF